jgi:hypothetical protein
LPFLGGTDFEKVLGMSLENAVTPCNILGAQKKGGRGNHYAQSTFCLLFAGVHFLQQDEHNCRRASSRGLIPRAKIKSVKMTFVIVFGKPHHVLPQRWELR